MNDIELCAGDFKLYLKKVYEFDLNSAIAILDEMYLFDFYLVDKKYNWLISEEHRGVLVSVGEPVTSNLQRYKKRYRQ